LAVVKEVKDPAEAALGRIPAIFRFYDRWKYRHDQN
jgi:hypothetical protein